MNEAFILLLFAELWGLQQPVHDCYDYHLSKQIWLWEPQAAWRQVQWRIYMRGHGLSDFIPVGHVMPGLWRHASRRQVLLVQQVFLKVPMVFFMLIHQQVIYPS